MASRPVFSPARACVLRCAPLRRAGRTVARAWTVYPLPNLPSAPESNPPNLSSAPESNPHHLRHHPTYSHRRREPRARAGRWPILCFSSIHRARPGTTPADRSRATTNPSCNGLLVRLRRI
ncbi:hypothetical protein VPH35_116013 [Triticum aestivum]